MEYVKNRREGLKSDYELICSEIPDFKQEFTYDEFARDVLMSSSRLYTISVGDKKTVAMVPYADQLNHTFP